LSAELERKRKHERQLSEGRAIVSYEGPAPNVFLGGAAGGGLGALLGFLVGGPVGAVIGGAIGAAIGGGLGAASEEQKRIRNT
jgi:outer membrane lipoprotein SlyB